MTHGMLAVFGLSLGELFVVLAVLVVGGMVLLGAGGLAYLLVRALSRKSEPAQHSVTGK